MTAAEFVAIAGEEQVSADDDLDNIIADAMDVEEDDQCDSEPVPVTATEAMQCLVKLRSFMEQNDKMCDEEMKMIRSLSVSTERMAVMGKRQSKITDFFPTTN